MKLTTHLIAVSEDTVFYDPEIPFESKYQGEAHHEVIMKLTTHLIAVSEDTVFYDPEIPFESKYQGEAHHEVIMKLTTHLIAVSETQYSMIPRYHLRLTLLLETVTRSLQILWRLGQVQILLQVEVQYLSLG